ncbi:MAG TPA: exopolysaccharide biosynthesis protein [Pseudomonadales bacterium]
MTADEHYHIVPQAGPKVQDLASLIERVEQLTYINGEVCLDDLVQVVGKRWFGPLLMIPGLVLVVPGVGDIPGVGALMGLVVLLLSIQAMFDRKRVWLPRWLACRNVSERKVLKAIRWVRKPAAFIDRHTRRRMTWAVKHSSMYVIAATCILIAAIIPVLELVPGSGMLAGTAITNFGLALLAHDGLIALVAIGFSLGVIGMLFTSFVL